MRAALVLLALLITPAAAAADWLITPFVGTTFGVATNIIVGDPNAGNKKFTFGGSFGLLTDGVLGIEGSALHVPHFFESTSGSLVLASGASAVSGRVIVAVPQAITGYSLRPYVAAGVGLMHVTSRDATEVLTVDSNLLALDLGGGAIGMLSNRTGLRFDLRHYRNLKPDDSAVTNTGLSSRLSFWLASVGFVYRF